MEQTLLGLIGVGLLGGAMAERLLGRGFRVLGTDIEPSRCAALRELGGEVADSAREVVRSCGRVLLSLPTGDVAAGVVDRVESTVRPGQAIIDTTTGEPGGAEAMGGRLAARGVAYLDATVSGSSEGARRGDVVVMAGGDAGRSTPAATSSGPSPAPRSTSARGAAGRG
jgi:3-hydroxyisobutyrate dehydrogenase-like beta-hydroxyacid dehydrogenase